MLTFIKESASPNLWMLGEADSLLMLTFNREYASPNIHRWTFYHWQNATGQRNIVYFVIDFATAFIYLLWEIFLAGSE